MWDPDLENFSDTPVFGPRKKDLRKFVEMFAAQFDNVADNDEIGEGELDTDEMDVELPKDLQPLHLIKLRDGETLAACLLIAGADDIDAIKEDIASRPIARALSHAWEYRELKRENERLRGQYEQLEDSVRGMEEQTRKVIHDMTAKDALHTRKVERERLVFGISNAARSSLKITEVLQNAVNQIGKAFGVSRCLLLRPNGPEAVSTFEYHHPLQQPVKELFYSAAGLIFMKEAMSREAPQDLGNPDTDTLELYDKHFLRALGLLSGLIIPLILRDTVLGVILIAECASQREWSIDDTALLGSLADLLCVAIENADLHEEREQQAVTDGLTGVANRRHFNEMFAREFERAVRHEQPLSLVVADLDYLKKINDTYGHQTGDEAIKGIARVMEESSRSIDLAARYGGEEFCLLLPNTDLDMANQIAERLRKLINDILIEGPGNISASIGVATYPNHATERDELFQQADEALYRAKQGGRNRVSVAEARVAQPSS
jgi:diguanylate cyclase (GGDEF)-like protein